VESLVRRWRRLDEPGLELLCLQEVADGLEVRSWVVHAGKAPFALRYVWKLDPAWSTRSVRLDSSVDLDRTCVLERDGPASWRVQGKPRPDLDGCAEIDVSATPFCNALAVRHLRQRSGELTTAYVDAPALSVTPSRQRYEALGGDRWRYVDLGVAAGFEATIELDADGLVSRYQGLFEAL
jgi:uncharacterized protein